MDVASQKAIARAIAEHPHEDIQPRTETECTCGRTLLRRRIHVSGAEGRICPVTFARYVALYGEPVSFTVVAAPRPAPTGSDWRARLNTAR